MSFYGNGFERPNYLRAKHEAIGLLDKFDIEKPPVDPVWIARQLGLQVIFVGFDQAMQDVSGFYDFEENTIFVNKDEYPLRQTFTVAHELGHKRLHEEWASSVDYKVLMRDQAAKSSDTREKEANSFAAYLLVPRIFLNRYWKDASVEELSRLFAVSVPVIRHRLAFEYGA